MRIYSAEASTKFSQYSVHTSRDKTYEKTDTTFPFYINFMQRMPNLIPISDFDTKQEFC
jgi:hypothetical protein